jgi:putative membrane protein
MSVVAVAAPLLSLGIAGTRVDPLRRLPAPLLAIPASLVELVVVWVWHAPALHHAARASAAGFAAEQAMFLASALFVWLCACAGDARMGARTIAPRYDMGSSSGAGVIALLLTSMHMTLLGALLGLAPRALYHDASIAALADQHLGGALMLVVGGSSYLFGALWLTARLLKRRVDEPETSP